MTQPLSLPKPTRPGRVIVVGAGVIGLTCAVRLLQAGHQVDVLARDLPLETTSSVAAAIWYPYLAYPADQVAAWSITTLHELTDQAAHGVPGVVMRSGTEFLRTVHPDEEWVAAVPDFTHLETVPAPYLSGYRLTVPIVEMSLYLPWLCAQVERLGGTITRMALGHLPAPDVATGKGQVTVVNCSGLGAYGLAGDRSLRPVRGQIVLIEQFGLSEFRLGSEEYIVPRSRDIVLGGTALTDNWSRVPDRATTEDILRRTARLSPDLADGILTARVLTSRVGLRPSRPRVRVESEQVNGTRVVHCYGHGGSGVTLSWGCAAQVCDIVGAT